MSLQYAGHYNWANRANGLGSLPQISGCSSWKVGTKSQYQDAVTGNNQKWMTLENKIVAAGGATFKADYHWSNSTGTYNGQTCYWAWAHYDVLGWPGVSNDTNDSHYWKNNITDPGWVEWVRPICTF